MQEADLEQFDLTQHAEAIQSAARPCLVGTHVDTETGSFFGGFPTVDDLFEWPRKNGRPLEFIGQLACCDLDLVATNDGSLLFFDDNRGKSYEVLYQRGERQTVEDDLPECEVSSLFGLRKRTVRPTVYQQVNVSFAKGQSFPSLERGVLSLNDDVAKECYYEFRDHRRHVVQVGGWPDVIQGDDLEQDAVKAMGFGEPDDWVLLLQLFEVGDFQFGDAGALYWFIHRDDIAAGRFDRVWMEMQCH